MNIIPFGLNSFQIRTGAENNYFDFDCGFGNMDSMAFLVCAAQAGLHIWLAERSFNK